MKRLVVIITILAVLCLSLEARRRWVPAITTAGGPTQIASDNFDSYANFSDLNGQGNWVNVSSTAVGIFNPTGTAGVAYATSAGAAQFFIRNTAVVNEDQYAETTIDTPDDTQFNAVGPAVRCQAGEDSGYGLLHAHGTLYLQNRKAGTVTTITSTAKTYVAGDKIRIVATGAGGATRLAVYENTGSGWVSVWTNQTPNDNLAGGFGGMMSLLDAAAYNNATDWAVGNW